MVRSIKNFSQYIIEMAPPANWDMNIFKQSFNLGSVPDDLEELEDENES